MPHSDTGARRSALATPAEAADFLRTSTSALSQMRYRRSGPRFVRHGRRVLYTWDDLAAYVKANTVSVDRLDGVA